ncbi:DUF1349 domain-containing protein [Acidaminobacter sp. JC074]|uniref:DUF1349 domain-containing protein n=1 Tax=Acidaminobacter sp. JC074 TaxID=2530199 RepID=UPI001F0D79B7|nr:DUF1349 domain-containing protein [Acidaminobacter sp. JC074]MCH4889245.1 DUF1349 domain-containing protein [Acidaminobacter sp. JC074]
MLDKWINEPVNKHVTDKQIEFDVLPKTDFWQVTHYGFSRTDGNCLVKEVKGDVCFTVKVKMNYISEFDQCGVIVYLDEENFAKLCVENQLKSKNKLGSVVCKSKRSDWATSPFSDDDYIYYRVSKRGINYLFESSLDGLNFDQMRLFDLPGSESVSLGVFGASPLGQGFRAVFNEFGFTENKWYLDMDDIPDEMK